MLLNFFGDPLLTLRVVSGVNGENSREEPPRKHSTQYSLKNLGEFEAT
jgi:hypothetical protein